MEKTKAGSAAGSVPSRKRKKQPQAAPDAPPADLNDPALYINRELSLLAFQRRVLEEAEDRRNPLLERVKFLAILGSTLNEFFMVRVAGLVSQMDAGIVDAGPDGMPPRAQLIAIRRTAMRGF
jgi:polyphosphate kinase